MKKIRNVIGIIILMAKSAYLFIDAYLILAIINWIFKVIQYELIFLKMNHLGACMTMFVSSLLFRSLIIFIYDFRQKDDFKIERAKEDKNEKIEKRDSLLNKIVWLQKLISYLKNTNLFKKLKNFIINNYWFKKFSKIFLLIFLNFAEPIFIVIYYREGHHKWNGIPNIKIFRLFTTSILLCSISLFLIFYGIKNLIF